MQTDSGESTVRGYSEKPSIPTSQVSAEAPLLPLGQGEYDEPIGLPLIVVCQNVVPAMLFLRRWIKWICWNEKWVTKKNYSTLFSNSCERFSLSVSPLSSECAYTRRRIITLPIPWLPSISFVTSLAAFTIVGTTTPHSRATICRPSEAQCCRSRVGVRAEWMGLMGQNSSTKRWF